MPGASTEATLERRAASLRDTLFTQARV